MSWLDQRPDDAMVGSFEAYAPEHIATVDPTQFREAMSQLGAAVHVVTTAGPAGMAGFTATAVVSVSDQPRDLAGVPQPAQPVLADPAREPRALRQHVARRRRHDRRRIRGRTSVPMVQRFDSGTWTALSTGAPVLTDAVVAFDCRVIEVKAVATHNVVFAGVVAVRRGKPGPALVYHERAYKQV